MNAPYLPDAAEVKADLVTYTEDIMNGLQSAGMPKASMQSAGMPKASMQSAGAKGKKAPKPELKRTDKKVKIGSVERTVYTGARGGKYVKLNGKIVPLSEAKKKK
jgi:hypothetical protein